MKYIKTYEGLFDFFKKKNKQQVPVSYDDIIDCLYDITDETRIITSLKNHNDDFGIYVSPQEILKTSSFCHLKEVGGLRFHVSNFDLVFVMKYYPFDDLSKSITDEEVNNLLEGVEAHLRAFGCEMSFYIGFGYGSGRKTEVIYDPFRTSGGYKDFMKMIKEECPSRDKLLSGSDEFVSWRNEIDEETKRNISERKVTVRIESKSILKN